MFIPVATLLYLHYQPLYAAVSSYIMCDWELYVYTCGHYHSTTCIAFCAAAAETQQHCAENDPDNVWHTSTVHGTCGCDQNYPTP